MDHKKNAYKMTIIDTNTVGFVKQIDTFLAIIEKFKNKGANSLVMKSANETMENLKIFRNIVVSGKLPRPSKGDVPDGTGLGLTRSIGEWTEDDDLLDAAYAVEKHYKEQM
jgi:hypothetical protein